MAIPKFADDLGIIQKLGDNPNTDDGLTAQELKERFDAAGLMIQKYINDVLIPNINSIQANGLVISETAPAGPALWFNIAPQSINGAAALSLSDDASTAAVQVSVDGADYGVENATVNQSPTAGSYDFTVL